MPSSASASTHHAAAARVICLLSLMALSPTVSSFSPFPSSSRTSAHPSGVAVSLYIDPVETSTPPSSSAPQSSAKSSPNSDSTIDSNSSATASSSSRSSTDMSTSAPPRPSRRRRRQEPQTAHITAASTPDEFDSLVRSEKDRMVVVRFHSPYCPACKSISVSYDRLAKINTPSIKFVDVTVTDRNDLIPYGLDVPATPYGQIWHPIAGLVEGSAIPRRQFSKFKKILKWYAKGECELPEEFFTNPHNDYDMENLIL